MIEDCSAHQLGFSFNDFSDVSEPSTMTLAWASETLDSLENECPGRSNKPRSPSGMASLHTTFDYGVEFVVGWNLCGRRPVSAKNRSAAKNQGRFTLEVLKNGESTNLIQIDRDVMRDISAELNAPNFDSFELSPTPALNDLQIWQNTATLAVSTMLDEDLPGASIFLREMPRLVAVTMLSCFPYRHASEPES